LAAVISISRMMEIGHTLQLGTQGGA